MFHVQLTCSLALCLGLALTGPAVAQTVSGIVEDDDGPIAGARVTLFDADTTFFRETRSDGSGAFAIAGVPPGAYLLGAAAFDRDYREDVIEVAAGGAQRTLVLGPETHPGEWRTVATFKSDTFGGTDSGILLADGRLLYCHDTIDPLILDPITNNAFRPPPSSRIQGCHAVRLLPDGRAAYVGGADQPSYGPGTKQVKAFDPATLTWELLPRLADYRWYPTVIQLADGALLAAGGGGLLNPERVNTSEVMDPETFEWTLADTLETGTEVGAIVLLYTGEVLMTHRPPQLFDPDSREWRLAADFVQGGRSSGGQHADHELVMLPDGRVVAIGYHSQALDRGTLLEIYDPDADAWSLGTNFAPVRSQASTLMLPDQRILVLGGYKEDPSDLTVTNTWGILAVSDLYDWRADTWRRLASMSFAREYHAVPILVPDGRVYMMAGEGKPGNPPDSNVVEVFRPPYLFRGVRPEISGLSTKRVERGDTLAFDVARTNGPTSVVLMGTIASTHFMDSGSGRYLELEFTQVGSRVMARVPSAPDSVPVGHYILYAMVDDIPSKGVIVSIAADSSPPPLPPPQTSDVVLSNWPNPFNPGTTFEIALPEAQWVTLTIFDARGGRVARVLDQRLDAGTTDVPWMAEDLAAGRYFAEMRTANARVVRKLTILR
jgi:Domain of unknown function (DUF1929)/Carboxypeptidase regulatory-like domain